MFNEDRIELLMSEIDAGVESIRTTLTTIKNSASYKYRDKIKKTPHELDEIAQKAYFYFSKLYVENWALKTFILEKSKKDFFPLMKKFEELFEKVMTHDEHKHDNKRNKPTKPNRKHNTGEVVSNDKKGNNKES